MIPTTPQGPRRPRLHRAASDRPYFSADGESYLAQTTLRELSKSRPLRVLSEEDFAHWQTYGYVVVREAIPARAARQLLDFTWDFQGLDPDRPDSWHEDRPFRSQLDRQLHVYGFVEAYHHQLLWDSRQAQRVYDAFVDVWDCEELWVTLDRLNLNPPNVGNRDRALIDATDRGFDIELHWDIDTTLGVPPQRVQGIIALNDTSPETGGFQCGPELFRRFEEWKTDQPHGPGPHPPFGGPLRIPGRAARPAPRRPADLERPPRPRGGAQHLARRGPGGPVPVHDARAGGAREAAALPRRILAAPAHPALEPHPGRRSHPARVQALPHRHARRTRQPHCWASPRGATGTGARSLPPHGRSEEPSCAASA